MDDAQEDSDMRPMQGRSPKAVNAGTRAEPPSAPPYQPILAAGGIGTPKSNVDSWF